MRADFEDENIYYHDSFRQPDHVATPRVITTCDEVKELLKKAREFRGLSVIEFNAEVKRSYVSLTSKRSLMNALVSKHFRWTAGKVQMEIRLTVFSRPCSVVTVRTVGL